MAAKAEDKQLAQRANMESAREEKRRRDSDEATSSGALTEVRTECASADIEDGTLAQLMSMPEDALDTDDETVDPTFDLDSSMTADVDFTVDNFCEDWVCHLERDDRVSLGLFLCFQHKKQFKLRETEAAEMAGLMIGKSDKAVREWRAYFTENGESKQGKYARSGILWRNEDLNRKATRYIRRMQTSKDSQI